MKEQSGSPKALLTQSTCPLNKSLKRHSLHSQQAESGACCHQLSRLGVVSTQCGAIKRPTFSGHLGAPPGYLLPPQVSLGNSILDLLQVLTRISHQHLSRISCLVPAASFDRLSTSDTVDASQGPSSPPSPPAPCMGEHAGKFSGDEPARTWSRTIN